MNEINKNELSKVEDNSLNSQQLAFMFSKTPENHIYERPAKGGGKWQYVTGTYVKKVLNLMFGWNWDFEVVEYKYNLEIKQLFVLGKLTCRSSRKTIVKMQFGRKDISFKTEIVKDKNGNIIYDIDKNGNKKPKKQASKIPLDLGNDLKAATTDALKKCANEIGIANDVYSPNEFVEIKVVETLPELLPNTQDWKNAIQGLINGFTIEQIEQKFSISNKNKEKLITEAI